MKITFRIFLLVLFALLAQNACYAQIPKLRSVKVELEDFSTESFYAVSCEDFDSMFKDTKKTMRFNKEYDLSNFSVLIKDFKTQKQYSFDVRGSITYYYANKRNKYCFNVFGVFYKDGQFFFNKKLLIYITDRLDGNHPKYLDTLRQQ